MCLLKPPQTLLRICVLALSKRAIFLWSETKKGTVPPHIVYNSHIFFSRTSSCRRPGVEGGSRRKSRGSKTALCLPTRPVTLDPSTVAAPAPCTPRRTRKKRRKRKKTITNPTATPTRTGTCTRPTVTTPGVSTALTDTSHRTDSCSSETRKTDTTNGTTGSARARGRGTTTDRPVCRS